MTTLVRELRTVKEKKRIRRTEPRFTKFICSIDKGARAFRRGLDRSAIWLLAVLSLVYFAVSGALAYWKLMWFDELCTYSIASLPNAAAIWSKLSSGTGPMPPSFYLLTRLSQRWLGPTHFAIRFPELLGFLIASWCVFHFIRRRTDALYGLIGMLAVWTTGAYPFAYEARPYGLVLAFCGLALVCWQAATENVRRRLALVGLFAACAGAVASHYGAVMLVFPFALGELTRSVSRRKVDWPVWLAFCGAALPLLIFFPLLRTSIRPYGMMWSHPHASSILECYTELLSMAAHPFAAILGGLGIWRALRARAIFTQLFICTSSMPIWEITAAIGLLLLPIAGLLQALLVTDQISARYVMPSVMGFAILLAVLARENLHHDAVSGLLITAVLFAGWGSHIRWEYLRIRPEAGRVEALYRAAEQGAEKLPIVINDGNRFFQLVHYTPAEFSARLIYLVDPEAARKYSGTDSPDLCLLRYRSFLPLNLVPADSFLRSGQPFLMYQSSRGWLLPVLKNNDARIELAASLGIQTLYRVKPNPVVSNAEIGRSDFKIRDSAFFAQLLSAEQSAASF